MTPASPRNPPRTGRPRALVVDWGGVLTVPLADAMGGWATDAEIDREDLRAVISDWLGPATAGAGRLNPVHALERGHLTVPDFEEHLATGLTERTGRPVRTRGLLARMFEHFAHAPDMAGLVLRARRAGVRTALLSNSWGNTYPRAGWSEMFDAVVISGEVGMRKPDPEIFHHTLGVLGVAPQETIFVDDLQLNVEAAAALGILTVLHQNFAHTAAQLETLGLPLATAQP